MSVKVAINGFGRIGRLAFRLMNATEGFEVVAINDLTDAEQLAYLLKYDSAQGPFKGEVSFEGDEIIVNGKKVKVYAQMDPANLPWGKLGVDVVLECTGIFLDETGPKGADKHILAGAKKVVISAPPVGNIPMVVYNVNDNILEQNKDLKIISGASCTTNCLAPVAKVLDDNFGIIKGFMTTVHAYTNDQSILDVAHKKGIRARRGRAAAANIIPSTTGAAKAVGKVLPHLKGKLDGTALRVPTITGSIVDLTVELRDTVTIESINAAIKAAANETLAYSEDPIVSSDVIGTSYASVFDADCTQLMNVDGKQLIKVMAWYDNEMSYTAQLIRTVKKFATI